ncbi:for [Symbiodinium sp. CCMP2592]|nr:for [Symbiodinium sp. CCMP2592]
MAAASSPDRHQQLLLPAVRSRRNKLAEAQASPNRNRTPPRQVPKGLFVNEEGCDATGRRLLPLASLRSGIQEGGESRASHSRPLSARSSVSDASSRPESCLTDANRTTWSFGNLGSLGERNIKRSFRLSKVGSMDSVSRVSSISELQAHAVADYFMSPSGPDFEIFRQGLVSGSLFCSDVDEDQLQQLARQAHLLRFKPGELASNKDQLGTGIFVVREGSFKLMNTSGRESFLGPGCVFGELELVQGCAGEVVAGDFGGTCFTVSSMALLSTIKALARTIGSRNLRFLSAVPLFRFLDSPDLAMLGRYAFSITHAKDACIYEAGQMPKEFLYIVKSGCLISQSNERERYIYPGECLDQVSAWCSRPHAETVRVSNEDDAAGMLAFSFQLLRDVLGDHMPDFLWRCTLLRMLRDVWSDRLSFGGPLMWRDDPEAFARACIIRSFPASSSELFSADEAASILWYVVLDGSLRRTGEDAMPGCSFCISEGHRGKQIRTTRDGCTLAMFLQDAIGTAAPYGDKLEVVKNALIFRNLDRTQQAQLAEAGHLLLRRRGQFLFKEGDLASHFFIIKEGEVVVSKGGEIIRTLGSFSTFGEAELLSKKTRYFSVKCKSDTVTVLAMDTMIFELLVKDQVSEQLHNQLRLRRTDIGLKDLRKLRVIGHGTFGTVQLMEHQPSGMRYALKRIRRSQAIARGQQQSLCNERELLTDLDHPFILKLVRTFKDSRYVYFLTEFVTGGELFFAIRSLGILAGWQARFYTGGLILALQALHEKRIVYRDLKPENVLLDSDGYPKLIDFGCAVRLGRMRRTLIGTPHYMAPEVILGEEYGDSCDVWSLGVCLYEFVCGPLPFANSAENPKQVFQHILSTPLSFPGSVASSVCKHLLRSLLRRSPEGRLGCGQNGLWDVREHVYFQNFRFDRMLHKRLEPPLAPSPPGTPSGDEESLTEDSGSSAQSSESDDWAISF